MRFKGKVAGRNLKEFSSEDMREFMKRDAGKKEKEN